MISNLIAYVYRFQEIAGAVETALYTPFAEATGLLFTIFMCIVLWILFH